MAAGEYVSVSSQADTEKADLSRERKELELDERSEQEELAAIYVERGLDPLLAKQVAEQLMNHDALAAHSRDELGISESLTARPVQAALASAGAFAVGAAMPLLTVLVAPESRLVPVVFGNSLIFLAALGVLAARTGGAPVMTSAFRVAFWGAIAMGLTAAVGALFGTVGGMAQQYDIKFALSQLQAEIPLQLTLPTIDGESVSLSVPSAAIQEWQTLTSH
jgi:VIT1/CCC1 family predicted Fe2+/Mn2+ transporter